MSRTYARLEDMSPKGKLTLLIQSDGDVIVGIQQDDGHMADVEFCRPGAGGGGSPQTWLALQSLASAMKEDNENPRATHRAVRPQSAGDVNA